MRTKKLLTYAALAGAAYWLYRKSQTTAAPAAVASPATGIAAAQPMGRLGYLPDGSDRPFAPHAGRYWRLRR